MAHYVDGFILPIPEANLDKYREIATASGELWREHGAIDYKECVAEDVKEGKLTDFFRSVDRKDGETVVFSWITYESRADRDRINEKVMADERMKQYMEGTEEMFDPKRIVYGGFEVLVDV
jgi:uncharacterized protein YbaA (DUF1428 family)